MSNYLLVVSLCVLILTANLCSAKSLKKDVSDDAEPCVPNENQSPLHESVRKNNIYEAQLLVENATHPNIHLKKDESTPHLAAELSNEQIANTLVEHGEDIETPAKKDVPDAAESCDPNENESPLHEAVRKNNMQVAQMLLENGADPNIRSKKDQTTPLHLAAELGNAQMANLLVEHGADVEARAKDGFTPLHVCAKGGKVNVAAVLARKGAEFDSRDENGSTPLHTATKFGRLCMVKFLVDYNSLRDNIPDNCDAFEGSIVRYLLEKGADPNESDADGITPLHTAAALNNIKDAEALLEYGANPNAQTKNGIAPLHIAAKEGFVDMVMLLLKYKADVNIRIGDMKSGNGRTEIKQ